MAMFIWQKRQFMGESRNDRFERLRKQRVLAVEEKIRVLSQLENPYTYEYTRDDIDAITSALTDRIVELEQKLQRGLRKAEMIKRRKT